MQLPGSTDLLGSIIERNTSSSVPKAPVFSSTAKAGFPSVQHRSKGKSAFAKSREDQRKNTTDSARDVAVPQVVSHKQPSNWRDQISQENEERVRNMTDDERERERQEIFERFGADVEDILRRAREAREGKEKAGVNMEPIPVTSEIPPPSPSRGGSPPPSVLSASSTRPNSPSRGSRKLRFAQIVPENVHVYESAPPSPRKKSLLALPPPPPSSEDSDIVSLGTLKNVPMAPPSTEYRNNFGIKSPPADEEPSDPISQSLSNNSAPTISTSPGETEPDEGTPELRPRCLHHHAEGKRAGYTLDDIFLLSRSKVPAQRAAMLGILKGVVAWWREHKTNQTETEDVAATVDQLQNMSPPLLKRVLFAGLEALPERGVVGLRAVEIVWECIVGWDPVPRGTDEEQYYEWGGIEVGPSELIDTFPLSDVLPQFVSILIMPPDGVVGNIEDAVPGTPIQHLILSILHRLAYHSNQFADQITSTSELVSTIFRSFIIVPTSVSTILLPDTRALRFLTTLALSSRANAKSLSESGDMLLRFIVTLKPSSETTTILPEALLVLIEIMRFYTTLGRYGIYAHIATDARELWWKIGEWIKDVASEPMPAHLRLICAWTGLLEAWMVCATDPHRTTPSHDLLWSQVAGWEWGKDLLDLFEIFLSLDFPDMSAQLWRTRAAVCRALAAWLEGSQVNGIKGGEEERFTCMALLSKAFQKGGLYNERPMIVIEEMKSQLAGLTLLPDEATLMKLGHNSYELTSVIRIWLACYPPSSQQPLSAPPFELPFPQISELCAGIVRNDSWRGADGSKASPYVRLFRRPITSLLVMYLRLSRHLPGVSEDIWLAQAFAILLTLQSGDEDYGLQIVDQVLNLINSNWANARALGVPQAIWNKSGWDVIRPFLLFEINPDNAVFPIPLCFSPRSISSATTHRLPLSRPTARTEWAPSGLPLRRDWTLAPLDHIAHSGSTSSLFTQQGLLPSSFDASETEIVRATLLLAQISREVVHRFANALCGAALSREEAVLGCMKVFMLEHEQDQSHATEEVFRDTIVARYMNELIAPYIFNEASHTGKAEESSPSLEEVAVGFLGSSTPFYQYYTDLVALYDSISFSYPLFARLLLPPTSLRYPIDYRKHLWDDFSHVMRTIRTPIDQLISDDVKEYLWPVERDPQMIGAYLRALIRHGSSLEGFVRFVAIHHIACNIWPDLQESDEMSSVTEERASKLFKAVVDQCGMEAVREVVKYRQQKVGAALLPPTCFDRANSGRLEAIERLGGPQLVPRLEGLFNE
uniref:Uncharacterized protein n=1 Tax=Moniliophthora roreri TaxID=221103 RepID=A0A0W0EV38_MONRR